MRLIARLDIKNEFVIKGIHLEGLRKIGDPNELAVKYYSSGADEIMMMDAVASLYDRNSLFHILKKSCDKVFIPITIGGGIRSIEDIQYALHAGADKVAVNTAAIKRPDLIEKASRKFGSQSIVGSIEAKKSSESWEAYIDNGREKTGFDVVQWAKELEKLGAGEILVTSVDCEGTKKGFDVGLVKTIMETVSVPVIASGGMGTTEHISVLCKTVVPSAIAVASVLHYKKLSVEEVKKAISAAGIEVRV